MQYHKNSTPLLDSALVLAMVMNGHKELNSGITFQHAASPCANQPVYLVIIHDIIVCIPCADYTYHFKCRKSLWLKNLPTILMRQKMKLIRPKPIQFYCKYVAILSWQTLTLCSVYGSILNLPITIYYSAV